MPGIAADASQNCVCWKCISVKQFCLAGNKPSLLQGNGTVRKGAGWALEENDAGACWSDALAGFTDAQGLNMGWELCPLPGQTLVP